MGFVKKLAVKYPNYRWFAQIYDKGYGHHQHWTWIRSNIDWFSHIVHTDGSNKYFVLAQPRYWQWSYISDVNVSYWMKELCFNSGELFRNKETWTAQKCTLNFKTGFEDDYNIKYVSSVIYKAKLFACESDGQNFLFDNDKLGQYIVF